MDLIARPKNRTSEKSRRALTENEKKVIENTEWNQRQELILKLFMNYGLRKQEATALQKRNIDLNQSRLIILFDIFHLLAQPIFVILVEYQILSRNQLLPFNFKLGIQQMVIMYIIMQIHQIYRTSYKYYN